VARSLAKSKLLKMETIEQNKIIKLKVECDEDKEQSKS